MDQSPPPLDLLESSHSFPGKYQIKAIGRVADDFEAHVTTAVRAEIGAAPSLQVTTRTTPDGRHVSLTLDIPVQTAEEVRAIYARIRAVAGLVMLL
jgi:putative lipoic acid-binding regulatory protein